MTEETVKINCKDCGSEDVIKWGNYKGVPRYFCQACKRKFKADNTPFHAKVSAQVISSSLDMYFTGMSIGDIRNHVRQQTGYYPSKSVVFGWVEKYSDQANKQFMNYHPKVGDTWIADETMIDLDNDKKVWFWDIIDSDTRFILASRVTISRKTGDAQRLIQEAVKTAGKTPKLIITDKQNSYPDGIFTALGGATEHLQSKPFTIASDSTNKIERFHETLKERTKVMKAFKDIETLITFSDGFLTYYNYLKPHESLNGKTPAEAGSVRYSVKTWVDVVNMPVSKKAEVLSHRSPRMNLISGKVNLDNAYKRTRITPSQPRITPKQGKLPLGGVFTDKKGALISRKKRKGWRRLY